MKETKRNINYDYVRSFAIMCVVLCHSIQVICKFNIVSWEKYSLVYKCSMLSFFTISRLGVPLFLMLTGALILKKEFNSSKDCFKFYKNNLMPLIIVTEIWIIIYNVFLYFVNNSLLEDFLKTLVKNMFFMCNVNMPNMWYMPMIIGIYIVVPFLSVIIKKFETKIILLPLSISILINMLIPTLNVFLKLIGKHVNIVVDNSFLGGSYGIYIVLGFLIVNGLLKNIKSRYIIIVGIMAFIITVCMQFIRFNKGMFYDLWYNNLFLSITSVAIFSLVTRLNVKENKISCFFTKFSQLSFGIFLVHILIQNLIVNKIVKLKCIDTLKVLSTFSIVFIISFVIVYVVSKFKY